MRHVYAGGAGFAERCWERHHAERGRKTRGDEPNHSGKHASPEAAQRRARYHATGAAEHAQTRRGGARPEHWARHAPASRPHLYNRPVQQGGHHCMERWSKDSCKGWNCNHEAECYRRFCGRCCWGCSEHERCKAAGCTSEDVCVRGFCRRCCYGSSSCNCVPGWLVRPREPCNGRAYPGRGDYRGDYPMHAFEFRFCACVLSWVEILCMRLCMRFSVVSVTK